MRIAICQLVLLAVCLRFLQASLQYFTSFHTFSHFFRHESGRPQTAHILVGKFCFFIPAGMGITILNYLVL